MKKDSFNANEIPADKGLSGNEKIEEAIAALQEEPSQELLAHTLTVIRRRMQEDGQLILAVEPPAGEAQLRIQAVQTSDGKQWWSAFTGFEEELKGSGSVMSTFLTEIRKLFESALSVNEIQGNHSQSVEQDSDAGQDSAPYYTWKINPAIKYSEN